MKSRPLGAASIRSATVFSRLGRLDERPPVRDRDVVLGLLDRVDAQTSMKEGHPFRHRPRRLTVHAIASMKGPRSRRDDKAPIQASMEPA